MKAKNRNMQKRCIQCKRRTVTTEMEMEMEMEKDRDDEKRGEMTRRGMRSTSHLFIECMISELLDMHPCILIMAAQKRRIA